MAQNITIAGASYTDVPAVNLPKTEGGEAKFVDTSGDTVTADTLLSGYTAHGADGELITGTLEAMSDLDKFINNTDIDYAYDEATDANYTVIRIYKNKIDGSKQYPFVVAPNGVNAGTYSTYDMANEYGYLLAINAGIFNGSTGKPDGMLIEDGQVLQDAASTVHTACKPLTIDFTGDLSYVAANASAEDLSGVVSAVCGFMPIIVDYESVPDTEWNSVSHYTENAQRQIIGQFGNGDYAIITCEGRGYNNSDGWTIAEAQTICKKHGLKFAYNLDGGGSTETMIGKKHINTIYEGETGRIVPTFIVFNGRDSLSEALPEYTPVEYLQVTDAQYINTGIPETELYSVEYKAINEKWTTTHGHILSSANTYYSFFKDLEATQGNSDAFFIITKFKGTEHNPTWQNLSKAEPHKIRNTYTGNGMEVYVDDVFQYTASIGSTASANNKYHLFTYGGNTGATQYRFTGKFYYLKMWDISGKLAHDFIPVIRRDLVYGVYDKVTATFYDSDTSVPFGGSVPDISNPKYTEIEYLQVDGSQYIDSGIPETELYAIEYKAKNEVWDTSAGHILSSVNTYMPFAKHWQADDGTYVNAIVAKLKGTETPTAVNMHEGVAYVIRTEMSGNAAAIYKDGTLIGNAPIGSTANAVHKYYFFTYGGNIGATWYRFTGKFYYMKMHDVNNALIHHYVAARRNDGFYGLYDKVTGKFYGSDGAHFIGGGPAV